MLSIIRVVRPHGCRVILPVFSEEPQRRGYATSVDFHHKRGPGGRSSFNGVVATVFGATGFLGRYVVNRLGRHGTQLIVPYRGDEHDCRHLKLMGDIGQINFVEYNLRDEESISKAVQYSNVVINLVGKDFETRNYSFKDCHIDGARSIARAAKKAGVKRFIQVSCLNAHTSSPSSMLQSKALGEIAVQEEFPEATIIRPADFYGHEDMYFNYYAYLRTLPLGIPLIDGGLSTIKRPVYVVDVARGIVASVFDEAAGSQTYELYGPKQYYLYDLIEFIYRVIYKPFRPYTMPRPIFNAIAWGLEQSFFDPRLTRDRLIRQFLSDELTDARNVGNFESLGITPSTVDEAAIGILRRHRENYDMEEALDDVAVCRPIDAQE